VLVLIAGTGLRRGEALALRWDNVDLAAGEIRVRETVGRLSGRLVFSEVKTANPVAPSRCRRQWSRC
jgi:integrase